MSAFLDALRERVLLCDGGMGSLVQAMDLSVETDFMGRENCTEALTLARPDVVRGLHQRYFAAGADCVESNTFGGSILTLSEFDLDDRTREINRRSVEIAREAAESFADGRQRFVLGSVGPGTRLPSLGHVDYDTLKAALVEQCLGLVEGGADAFLIETCQDPLQFKAAINAAKAAREAHGADTPIMLQVTVETTGTLLVGADIAAAATVAHALGVDSLGLNCATGPREMGEHVRWMAENWPGFISVQPNAGLPELVDGKAHYPLTPAELADWHKRFILEDGVNMVGGCCGTTPAHIEAVDAMLRALAAETKAPDRPKARQRTVHWVPSVASLYGAVPLRQENAFLSIGERCNANGSKKFRTLQDAEDWDAIVAMAREQGREGSHTLDVCTAFVGRDESRDMTEVITRLRGSVHMPLVVDSTETRVLEAALKLYGGKAILNSINFEDGEETAAQRLALAREHGAAVIALTIDEEGMAKDADAKLAIAHRLYDFAVNRHGLPPEDLLFDPLTFTICTGNEDDRRLGLETLEAIRRIRAEMPACGIILGLSNISFGLKPAARQVLNSVFLDEAVQAGMTGAIVHVSKIVPRHRIPAEEVEAAMALIHDQRDAGDPLHAFIRLFEDRTAVKAEVKADAPVEERLRQRIIDGDRLGLEADLDEARATHPPLEIINTILLDGMRVVGELFGSGKMQLPFVLQSAETMKAAVALLEPHMEKSDDQARGTLVLATVKGDVHDIGKNLVDIILSNNGYKVVNLGIKQPLPAIVEAARAHKADAIGLSGLLVKSTVIMKDNLEEMARDGWDTPVILGGAALTRAFVEDDCVRAYGNHGRVAYARDAFDGLDLMGKVMEGLFDDHLTALQEKRKGAPSRRSRAAAETAEPAGPLADGATLGADEARSAARKGIERPVAMEAIALRRAELARAAEVPQPPFWGPRLVEGISLKSLVPFINENTLFQFQWGFRKAGRTLAEWKSWAETEVRPILFDLLKRCAQEEILNPRAVYGFWKAASRGDSIVLFAEDGQTEVAHFELPRQKGEQGLCLADFVRDESEGPQARDVVGLQAVTVGARASEVARAWFADNHYRDYLLLHGLSVEVAEALAEYTHKQVRAQAGVAADDAREAEDLFRQSYRGARYSFGYPACPNLEDQRQILDLLGADRIGLDLSDEFELEPEQSTSALVLFHPQAKYFRV
ncbi:methionine synthase [Pararhodospirillum oryzae]|uniref:Methionine synthase n=1 Tax=Pararhodospirillum oryzae TaxID=478448 RepID=A0A512H7L6_9PROT|nr:methionine synthase [Pararhodospirillum oryzae]GEO81428.1 methionine synthase [Pararhodospirillum oryzae]